MTDGTGLLVRCTVKNCELNGLCIILALPSSSNFAIVLRSDALETVF